ncbi:hypothetical protein Q0Q83_22415, partial [Escherichia marmotae]
MTFSVDTVRTDTTASNPVCLPEKYGNLLHERHPDLFAGAQGIICKRLARTVLIFTERSDQL